MVLEEVLGIKNLLADFCGFVAFQRSLVELFIGVLEALQDFLQLLLVVQGFAEVDLVLGLGLYVLSRNKLARWQFIDCLLELSQLLPLRSQLLCCHELEGAGVLLAHELLDLFLNAFRVYLFLQVLHA